MRSPSYQSVLAICAVMVCFTGLPTYLFTHSAIPPLYFLLVLALCAVPSLPRLFVPPPLPIPGTVCFALFYAFIAASGFMLSSQSTTAQQAFEMALLSAVLLFLLFVIFTSTAAVAVAKRAVLVCVVLGICVNLFEFFIPGAFSMIPGRSAGFYMNPNNSAIALVLGMTLTIGILPRKWREVFVVSTGLSVALTFSRAGLLVWAIAATLLFLQSSLSPYRLIATLLLVIGVIVAGALFAIALFSADPFAEIAATPDLLARILFFVTLERDDFSSVERWDLFLAGWNLFSDHPILGAGIGATREWEYRTGPHNMYMTLTAEHGVLGFLIIPLMAIAVSWRARGETAKVGLIVATVLLTWSLFDHNVLHSLPILLIAALQSAAALYECRIGPRKTDHSSLPTNLAPNLLRE